jgi:hypothetical protein
MILSSEVKNIRKQRKTLSGSGGRVMTDNMAWFLFITFGVPLIVMVYSHLKANSIRSAIKNRILLKEFEDRVRENYNEDTRRLMRNKGERDDI